MIGNLISEISESCGEDRDQTQEWWIMTTGLLAARFACFPFGPLPGTALSLVSSRLPERRDLCSWWYDILRTACARCDPEKEYLLAVPGTTCFQAVVRASELFGIRRVEFELPQDDCASSADSAEWCRSRIEAHRSQTNRNELVTPAILSPQLAKDIDFRREVDVPLRDALSFDFADRIVVLHSRKNGSVHGLCQHYLKEPDGKLLMLARTSNQPKADSDLIAEGAIPWLLFDDHPSAASDPEVPTVGAVASNAESQVETAEPTDDGPIDRPEDWLCHWTRPFRSAWPDQSPDEFLDELILGCQTADRSALAALIRIIQQQKLIASVARKDERATVSMTAVPLTEFRQRRVFRGHRRRYDFEPYGVAIRKSVLVTRGAKPVQYVEEDQAQSHSNRLYQQPKFDRTGKIDWSSEREWRLEGSLDLSNVSDSDVCVFVSNDTERFQLEKFCALPIIVVP